jgi:hypothetical protein
MKKLPPALLLALGLQVATAIAYVVWMIARSRDDNGLTMSMVFEGVSLSTYVLGAAGTLELARQTTGRESVGLRITAVGFGLGIAMTGFWQVVNFAQPHWDPQTWQLIARWTNFTVEVAQVVGLIVATSQRHRTAALAGVVVLLVAEPVPPLAKLMYGWIGSFEATVVVQHALYAGSSVTMIVLASLLARGEADRAPDAATSGLRTFASALWLRVISIVTLAGLTFLLVLGKATDGAEGTLKLALMAAAVVNVVSLIMLARGALGAARSGIVDLPRWPFVLSAGGTMWYLGVALYQLPYNYRMLYGSHDPWGGTSFEQKVVQALTVAVALVFLGAIAIVATAISGFAARRGLDQLRAEAQGKSAAFVVLMLVALALQAWLIPTADSTSTFGVTTVAAMAALLVATAQMARLCTHTADLLHTEPPLPKATVL